MGNLTGAQNAGVEELDIAANSAYRYPPKSGCYFGSHFMMGGQRFETAQPESYLFGENSDLNFLGSRPAPFPYPAPQSNEPTKTLKSLVNIRKDSLKLVKENRCTVDDDGEEQVNHQYTIEFTFDTEAKVGITIYYFASEDINNGKVMFTSKDPTQTSETFHYKRGANQQFVQPNFIVDPSKFSENELNYDPTRDSVPMVIQCNVEEPGDEFAGHSHILFATFEKTSEGSYMLKPLKQKQMVDGVCYLLQEIYGIENKTALESNKLLEDDFLEDNGSECVICMCDLRDTLILPCRHLCLCSGCADSLRYQSSCCPICRAPFRALLQIRALRKKTSTAPTPDAEDNGVSQENVPPGYEAVPLGEALNGPQSMPPRPPPLAAEGGNLRERSDGTTEGRTRRGRRKPSQGGNSLGSSSLRGSAVLEEAEECREENQHTGQSPPHNALILPVPVEVPSPVKKEKPRKLSLPTPTSPPYSSPVISPLSNPRSETTPEPMSEGVSDCPSCRNSNIALDEEVTGDTKVTAMSPTSDKSASGSVKSPQSEKSTKPPKPDNHLYDDVLRPDEGEDDDEMPYEEDVYSRGHLNFRMKQMYSQRNGFLIR
ncbi:probable E3 ubiquitin-protein ligase MGRN1 isoform X2 [Ptychodera flava]|uniref:probable E3 ubiquitin-protein ligase MGRN1 isoform X2 n=1 Tax=Ptychodera flava TaxID=63121 RepID=UPI00396A4C60